MIIDKIKKISGNRYKIFFDNIVIVTYDDVILNNDLLYKKSIDKNLYDKILLETNYYDIYNKTVKYIMKRRRSEKNIIIYLNKFNLNEKDKSKIINKLKDINLINDKEYCKAYINDRVYLYKEGINKIKQDLIKEGISIDMIDKELQYFDKGIMDEKLEKLIIKKIRTNKKYSNYYLKQKIFNEMINLGYDKQDVLRIIDNNIIDDSEVLNNEFNKVYNQLKSKYSGVELNNKIIKKLITRGFSINEINRLLEIKKWIFEYVNNFV